MGQLILSQKIIQKIDGNFWYSKRTNATSVTPPILVNNKKHKKNKTYFYHTIFTYGKVICKKEVVLKSPNLIEILCSVRPLTDVKLYKGRNRAYHRFTVHLKVSVIY